MNELGTYVEELGGNIIRQGAKTFAALSVGPKKLALSPPRPPHPCVHLDEPDASSN